MAECAAILCHRTIRLGSLHSAVLMAYVPLYDPLAACCRGAEFLETVKGVVSSTTGGEPEKVPKMKSTSRVVSGAARVCDG